MDTEAIIKLAYELGLALKETDEVRAADAAEAAFADDEVLQEKINEYSALQESLATIAASDDQSAADAVRARLDALYEEIINDPRYVAYNEAQGAVSALMHRVNDEINFAITGHRGCSGHCGECGGCH